MALTNKLTAIADAIRAKTGSSDGLSLDDMPTAISSISGGGDVSIVYDVPKITSSTGTLNLTITGQVARKALELGLVEEPVLLDSTSKSGNYIYYQAPNAKLPDIVISLNSATLLSTMALAYTVEEEHLPHISTIGNGSVSSIDSFFNQCKALRGIPSNFFDDVKFTSNAKVNSVFKDCYTLRIIPQTVMEKLNTTTSSYGSCSTYFNFYNCYSLDEVVGLYSPYAQSTALTSNAYSNCCSAGYRLKRIVFNSPYAQYKMKSQNIDLSTNVGWGNSYNFSVAIQNGAGYTTADLVDSDETYAAKKNSSNWYAQDMKWSRYNKISAIETIASLPDTSVYLASAGGTNTIKFRGNAGSNTDGGAINTMTAEEIAVATAKGWTVTFV